ncbi:hypothetical protein DBR47_00295 [Paucibacter sp. KBW04]|uniref:hypothetical protein n=1 Tax=Paucibacter sp. KBW04 TaxID=2153361 RepID=UPI000F56529B|nr:hypothetical protein [Paucibacter sp. KBW04]RQO63052.1 hypothetical protein DBR47_00295 [Paucibacter sp. KBW04]
MKARFAWRLCLHLGLVLGLLLGLFPPGQAAPVKPGASPLDLQLDRQYQNLQALQTLDRRAAGVQAQARALQADSPGLSEQSRALLQRAQDLGVRLEDLQSSSACVQALHQAQQALNARLKAWQAALQSSQQAVQAVAAVAPEGLAEAGRRSDQAFDQRQAAEQGLALARETWGKALGQCRSQLAQSDAAVQDLLGSSLSLRVRALAMAESAQALQTQTQALLREARQPGTPTLAGYKPAPQQWPSGDGLSNLLQALSAQPLPDRLGLLEADGLGLAELNRQLQILAQLQSLLPRLQDAASYARMADAGEGAEAEAARAEMQALSERSQRAQQDLDRALQAMQTQMQSLPSLLQRLSQTQQTLAAQLQLLNDKLPAAQQQALQTAAQVGLLVPPLQTALQLAKAQAQRAWERSYLARFGHPPDEGVAAGAAPPPAPAPAPSPKGPTAAVQPPSLAGHAYQFFKELGSERGGFGAYSYVLLHSGSDLLKPDVAKRYAHVLAVLQREREASTVAASEAAMVNLFCLPGSVSSYADDLGKQILFRAQSGLLTRPEMKKRLGPKGGSGPFLITLPVRLSEARSSTPLLFVDLSLYPEDTVADLLSSYMSDLLRDFPREQLRWKPPVLQQVALTLIGLSSDFSGLVMSVLPTASAAESIPKPKP